MYHLGVYAHFWDYWLQSTVYILFFLFIFFQITHNTVEIMHRKHWSGSMCDFAQTGEREREHVLKYCRKVCNSHESPGDRWWKGWWRAHTPTRIHFLLLSSSQLLPQQPILFFIFLEMFCRFLSPTWDYLWEFPSQVGFLDRSSRESFLFFSFLIFSFLFLYSSKIHDWYWKQVGEWTFQGPYVACLFICLYLHERRGSQPCLIGPYIQRLKA